MTLEQAKTKYHAAGDLVDRLRAQDAPAGAVRFAAEAEDRAFSRVLEAAGVQGPPASERPTIPAPYAERDVW